MVWLIRAGVVRRLARCRRYAPAMPACLFCEILTGTIPALRIAEDAEAMAFMDINPAVPGHALVIPRDHSVDALAAPPAALAACMVLAGRVGRAAELVLGATGVTFLSCARPDGGQTVFHLHVHVLPRQPADGLSFPWLHKPGDPAVIETIAGSLRSALY